MLSDYELYVQLLTKRGITPPPEISEAIRVSSSTGELRLSSLSFIIPVCEVIGRVLASSSTISSVDLSDCMLVSKGLSKILAALCDGSNITSMSLKGNNISGAIVSQLGDILHQNNTLKHLYMEWNAVGTDTEAFEKFCKGLCINHSIEELDLRYNQISRFCAQALSMVLMRNKSLKIVNLAWNALGADGGKLLLEGLRENSNITRLDLRGNSIPIETIGAIDNCIYNNQSKKITTQSNISKVIDATKVVVLHENSYGISSSNSDDVIEKGISVSKKRVKKKSFLGGQKNDIIVSEMSVGERGRLNADDVNPLISHEIPEEYLNKNESRIIAGSIENFPGNRVDVEETKANKKLSEVNKMLRDRTTAINALTNEISSKDTEIEAAKLSIDQLRIKINHLKDENEQSMAEHAKEIADLKSSHKLSEENWNKIYRKLEEDYKIAIEKNKEWENKSRRYERDIHKCSLEIISLREKSMSKSQSYEDLMVKSRTELHRAKRELQDRENRYKIEFNVLKSTLKETTDALEECQSELQKSRVELRDTLVQLSNVKLKLNQMEHIDAKYIKLDECMQKIKEEKSITEEKLVDAQRTIASLKRQIATLQQELIEPQRQYNLLKDDLDNEKEKSTRLKRELADERARIKEQDIQMQMMNSQITTLNIQINDIQKSHADDIREKDREKKQLKEIIITKERDLNDLKAEEAQRASQLYAAFSKYLSSIGPNTCTS